MKNYLLTYALVTLALVGVVCALNSACSLPIVQESYSTGEIVQVIDPSGEYNLENLPSKYIHEWVK